MVRNDNGGQIFTIITKPVLKGDQEFLFLKQTETIFAFFHVQAAGLKKDSVRIRVCGGSLNVSLSTRSHVMFGGT